MTLATGTKLARYEIRSKIGEGGMGEVYLARDTQLGREVAVKVLPAEFSQDAERLHRFEQEACAASALNHPNILSIYDVGMHDGSPYVVSELLLGQTLHQRISGTSLPQRKTIDLALQVAHGLAAAHEKGIVHRDLKPDNLFITNDGRVKILDFGLAKLTGAGNTELSQTSIPTRRVDTDPGKVMGTVGYMSPEQVKGHAVDHRSDIFSFGAILYEMLSGRRAFHGESSAETLSAILKEEPPDISDTNQRISPALERLVHHCLEKSPEERFHSARDLAFALEALSGTSPTSAQTTAITALATRRMTRRELILASVAGAAILAAVALAVAMIILRYRASPTEEHLVRFPINPPEKTGFNSFAISPDGLRLVFVATDVTGKSLLWVRSLASVTPQQLPGTDDATFPFWSPDSRFIGFFAAGNLKKVELASGTVQTLCKSTPVPRGGTWSRNGVIVFAPTPNASLHQVSVAGGDPTPFTRLDTSHQEASHRWPYFLPDGKHVLYSVQGGPQSQGIYVTSLDGKQSKRLLNVINSTVAFAAPGYLLFRRESTLMAQAFDADTLQLRGDPFPVAEQVGYEIASFQTFFSVSQTGVLAYSSSRTGLTQLSLIDRAGKELRLGAAGNYVRPWLSPDGKYAALDGVDPQGNRDIWLMELASGNPTRFTFDPATDIFPVWSPDGSRLVFSSDRQGPRNIYQKSATGAGKEELLYKTDSNVFPSDWSADGRFIIYMVNDPKTGLDAWVLPLAGDQKPFPFLQTEANERAARFSPNGQWIAYTSDESGLNQIYVQSFPDGGGKRQISVNGGYWLAWRRDGKELFYVAADKKMMAVDVKGDGPTFEVGTPKALFDMRVPSFNSVQAQFAVTADGQKFLVANSFGELSSAPIEVVLNWTAELKK